MTVLHNKIYVSGPIFVKLDKDFNLNIYHLAAYLRLKKTIFPIEHMKFTGPSIKLASWLDFLSFTFYLHSFGLLFWITKGT